MEPAKSTNLVELFELQVTLRGHETAVFSGEHYLSYEALNQKVNQCAYDLLASGITELMPVAVAMERSIDFLIVILAILKIGCAYVPLDVSQPEERLLGILHDNKISYLITLNSQAHLFVKYTGKVIIYDFNKALLNITNPDIGLEYNQLAYIIFTSGSTGKPKGVLIEHQSVVNFTKWFSDYFGMKPQQIIDFSSNCSFDFAVATSLVPLLLGMRICICEQEIRKDPLLYLKYLENNQINVIKLTPSYFNVLINQAKVKQIPLLSLQTLVFGGENLSPIDCANWLALYPNHIIFNEYGPTEATVAVSAKRIDINVMKSFKNRIPIGSLMPNCTAYILDEQNNQVMPGQIGELYLGGSCLARGYLHNETLTKNYFIKNTFSADPKSRLYKTGDLCNFLPNGELECRGRVDDQVKIRGFRVDPKEIEMCLNTHPAIKAAVITAKETESGHNDKTLVAYTILKNPEQTLTTKSLSNYLKKSLPEVMIPSTFIYLKSFPLNANDKVDYKALKMLSLKTPDNSSPPKNATEQLIAQIWSKELDVQDINIHHNFFELGGHSLSAARIVTAINGASGKELSLKNFYQNPTIFKLAQLVDSLEILSPELQGDEDMYQDSTALPLSDFQSILWFSNIFERKARHLTIYKHKRFVKHLEDHRLKEAFNQLLQKHEVLRYKVSSFSPTQQTRKKISFHLRIEKLESEESKQVELVLEQSLQALRNLKAWPQQDAALIARVFYLSNDQTEIHLCMPHILADEVSLEILFKDLIRFYNRQELPCQDKTFKEYLFLEHKNLVKHLNQDLTFWHQYLKDSNTITLPTPCIAFDMKKNKVAYSHYTEIPKELLSNLQIFCSKHQLSLDDGLCAIFLLALNNCSDSPNANKRVCFSKVKSTRNEKKYDQTVGCFLNLDLAKVSLSTQQDVISLSRQIRQSFIETSPYQRCASLGKLASIATFRKPNWLKETLVSAVTTLYNFLPIPYKMNKKIISMSTRLNNRSKNDFLLNFNITNSFLKPQKQHPNLPHEEIRTIPLIKYDLLEINNLIDVCFLRTTDHKPYMVVSANLDPAFQITLKHEVLALMATTKS